MISIDLTYIDVCKYKYHIYIYYILYTSMLPTSSNQKSKRMQKDPWQLPQTSPLQSPAPLAATLPHSDSTFPWRSAARSPGEHLRHPVTVTGWTQKWGPTLLMATRNPANSPVEVGSWKPIIYRVLIHLRWLFGISSINCIFTHQMAQVNPESTLQKREVSWVLDTHIKCFPWLHLPKHVFFFEMAKKRKCLCMLVCFLHVLLLSWTLFEDYDFHEPPKPWKIKVLATKKPGYLA